MVTLTIHQQPKNAEGQYPVIVTAEIPGQKMKGANAAVSFELSAQDSESIRWYLEEYLQFYHKPAPQIAARVEARMAGLGETLFRQIFANSPRTSEIWNAVQPHLGATRIEIKSDTAGAASIPWELIRNPDSSEPLALEAKAFLRGQRETEPFAAPTPAASGQVRVLLVICRPDADADVPFRMVSGPLVKRLSGEVGENLDLQVLRPPTYDRLSEVLRDAKAKGHPYHIVHFDGHGGYGPYTPAGPPRGVLLFEGERSGELDLVDGREIGKLLAETRVPVLVLNACRSAYAESREEPRSDRERTERIEVQAYSSLAQDVIAAGTPGVVAMRYAVYVVTAAQFVAELYSALARGQTLGEGVAAARRHLADKPERRIAYEARPLQDWSVPVVWERAPLRLWPEKRDTATTSKDTEDRTAAKLRMLDARLPATPDVGFFGRHETMYALDRAFDRHSIVLLQAYAGSGKTATAAEFARWYALTGGIEGPVLFTSFEHFMPLSRVLDQIGEVFQQPVARQGIVCDAFTERERRRDIALQMLTQVPVLWIWDNVEPVAGFPAGTDSKWSSEEQQELRDFLGAAGRTQAKFLLTSRRDEVAWLGKLPLRIPIPPMPMLERLQLASAVAEARGKPLSALPDLRDLLRFTEGNPLTIRVTVGLALHRGIKTRADLDAFIAELRSGQAAFEDEENGGRSDSLSTSLSYGFQHAFSDEDRRVLALLHLFQGSVWAFELSMMGNREAPWCLESISDLTEERSVALLDRAAEVGLLTAHGNRIYSIHPGLPWFLGTLFAEHYPGAEANAAHRAFVGVFSFGGQRLLALFDRGHREVVGIMIGKEQNLLAAYRLARTHGWWTELVGTMLGLKTLYLETGQRGTWVRLVDAIVAEFVDPTSGGPLPGRDEEAWSLVTEFRVGLAMDERRWDDAERMQLAVTKWSRSRVEHALNSGTEETDEIAQQYLRHLSVGLENLGKIQMERGEAKCVATLREAAEFAHRSGERPGEATCAFNIGNAYATVPRLRNLNKAEHWYRRSLDLRPENDNLGRAKSLAGLGQVAFFRFQKRRYGVGLIGKIRRLVDAVLRSRALRYGAGHLTDAVAYYNEVLQLLPATQVRDRGVAHYALGNIWGEAGDFDEALKHYREDIRACEQAGDVFGAGQTRFNVAHILGRARRHTEAREYASAALSDFRACGAEDMMAETVKLVAMIDDDWAKLGGTQ